MSSSFSRKKIFEDSLNKAKQQTSESKVHTQPYALDPKYSVGNFPRRLSQFAKNNSLTDTYLLKGANINNDVSENNGRNTERAVYYYEDKSPRKKEISKEYSIPKEIRIDQFHSKPKNFSLQSENLKNIHSKDISKDSRKSINSSESSFSSLISPVSKTTVKLSKGINVYQNTLKDLLQKYSVKSDDNKKNSAVNSRNQESIPNRESLEVSENRRNSEVEKPKNSRFFFKKLDFLLNDQAQEIKERPEPEPEPSHQKKKSSILSVLKSKFEGDDSKAIPKLSIIKSLTTHYYIDALRHYYNARENSSSKKIYLEHFNASLNAVNYGSSLKETESTEILSKTIFLPPRTQRKTLILDLDETLIHCNTDVKEKCDTRLFVKFPGGEIFLASINIRPYCREFLEEMSIHFEVVIFTASMIEYAEKVVDFLDPEKKYISYICSRDQCVSPMKNIFLKDLRIFANRFLRDLVIVDNSVLSFVLQLENGVPIIPFTKDREDKELLRLKKYLLNLVSNDIRRTNYNTFKFQLLRGCTNIKEASKKLWNK